MAPSLVYRNAATEGTMRTRGFLRYALCYDARSSLPQTPPTRHRYVFTPLVQPAGTQGLRVWLVGYTLWICVFLCRVSGGMFSNG